MLSGYHAVSMLETTHREMLLAPPAFTAHKCSCILVPMFRSYRHIKTSPSCACVTLCNPKAAVIEHMHA